MARGRRFHTLVIACRGENEAIGYLTFQIDTAVCGSLTAAREVVRDHMSRAGFPENAWEWT